ncbi:winged helix-turn-helix domain-containing protein [Candidatus Parcubacteria bacterium]|nr:winged helix-turn-helix domain-containing protein [Candidatus Parcubacteria bacterium]
MLLINKDTSISKEKIAQKLNLTVNGVKYYIKKFNNKGILEWIGPPRSGYWKILKK